jgi:hypothetical protein
MPITSDNIHGLLKQLSLDLKHVLASQPAQGVSPGVHGQHRQRAQLLIGQLTNGLQSALLDDQTMWNGWVQSLRPLFTNLSVELKFLLNEDSGACDYDGGCISNVTRSQCSALPSSTFRPGGTCP